MLWPSASLVCTNVTLVRPEDEAVTLDPPEMAFAVKVDAVATPDELVLAVVVTVEFANVPLAPVDGAVNVTDPPLSGEPPASVTVAASAVPNAPLTLPLCGVPAEV